MGCVFSSCICCTPCLNSYLHVYVRSIDQLTVKGDTFSLDRAGGDLYIRITYRGQSQSTRILRNSDHDAVFNEGLILNNCYPSSNGSKTITIELIDYDCITGDDVLGICHIEPPTSYGLNNDGKKYRLIGQDGSVTARLKIDQLHFIHEKLNRYTGPCKILCCCCCNTGMCSSN